MYRQIQSNSNTNSIRTNDVVANLPRFGILIFISLGLINCCWSQQRIAGKIFDENGGGIPYANVILSDSTDETVTDFTMADVHGSYEVPVPRPGRYTLSFSAMGFADERRIIHFYRSDSTAHLDVTLNARTLELHEVIVEADKPITIKKDTVVFNAKSFSDGSEEVVEDLLKKIPGLEVDADGTIRVGGKEVEKVMIEGDDFFQKGYKLLTKNMPSQPVHQVELLQNYSGNPLLKGIEDSDKVALNLVLEKDAKNQWFANVAAGFGTNERYSGLANVFNFGKRHKYYFLANGNNIGYDATGDIQPITTSNSTDDRSVLGMDAHAAGLLNLTPPQPDFKKDRTTFNNDQLASANAILNPNERFKISAMAFLNRERRSMTKNSTEQFRTATTAFTNTESDEWDRSSINSFGRVGVRYDASETRTLETHTTFHHHGDDVSNRLAFNGQKTAEDLDTDGTRFDQRFNMTNKVSDNFVWLVNARYLSEEKPQHYHVNQFFFHELFPGAEGATRVSQTSEATLQYAGVEWIALKRTKAGDLAEWRAGNEFRREGLSAVLLFHDDVGPGITPPFGYQNDLDYLANDSYLVGRYTKSLGKLALFGEIGLHYLLNRIRQPDGKLSQHAAFANPSMGAKWIPNDKNKLAASVSYNTTNAVLPDVYPNWLLTGFRSFIRGAGTFNQLDATTAVVFYQRGHWTDGLMINALLLYKKDHDFLSHATVLQPNFTQSQKVLFRDRRLITMASNADQYVGVIASNVKVQLSLTQSTYKNIVNDVMREVANKSYALGLEIRSGFPGFFNYHVGSRWTRNVVTTRIKSGFTNNLTFIDLVFRLHNKSNLALTSERYSFGNVDINDDYYFLDFNWKYSIKQNKLALTLTGRNLFNTDRFTTASISDVSTMVTSYALLPRYVMLKVDYRF